MKVIRRIFIYLTGALISLSANAFDVAQEFSAEAIQSSSGRLSMNVKMFVSKNAVRTEPMNSGNPIIEIVYPKEKKRILLNSVRKIYVEQKAQVRNVTENKKSKGTPCFGIENATCKKMGVEKKNNRQTTKWEMTVKRGGQVFRSLHWIDKKHNMPLREQLHDGTLSTLKLIGKEKVSGRSTEKWKFEAVHPNGQRAESLQWYDSKLKMVIREELPNGSIRELKNIKIAKQKKSLFKVPSGYKKENVSTMNNQRTVR